MIDSEHGTLYTPHRAGGRKATMPDNARRTVRLPVELNGWLSDWSRRAGLTASDCLRLCLEYARRTDPPLPGISAHIGQSDASSKGKEA